MRQVVLYSGGLDSYITMRYAKLHEDESGEVIPVYFPLGHRYELKEKHAISILQEETRIDPALESLGFHTEEGDAHIPNRNAFLIIAAAHYLEKDSGTIYLTVQEDELSLPDRSIQFLSQMSTLLDTLGYSAVVTTPWETMDKTDMIGWFLKSGGSTTMLKRTWSCYRPKTRNDVYQCGGCPACFRRAVALSHHHIFESYASDPFKGSTAELYKRRAEEGYYSEKRNKRILEALR